MMRSLSAVSLRQRPLSFRPGPGPRALATLSALLLTLGAAGCSGSGDGDGDGGGDTQGRIQGSLSVFLPDATTLEAEPNDSPDRAHKLGTLASGQSRTILGSITEAGSDLLDGFEFVAEERILVDVTLTPISGGADLDLFVVDPVSLQDVASFATVSASESGTFVANGTFFLVVDSFSGDTDYELRVDARPLGGPISESEPNDTAAAGTFVGSLTAGEFLEVSGDGSGGTSDFVLVALPAAATLSLSCAFGVGDDYDLRVHDVTSSLAAPVFLDESISTTDNPETLAVAIPGMALIAVEVVPFSGSTSAWTLGLSIGAGLQASGGRGGQSPLSRARRASIDEMTVRARGGERLAAFTRAPRAGVRGDLIVQANDGHGELERIVEALGGRIEARVPGGPAKVHFDLAADLSSLEADRYSMALAAVLRGQRGVEIAERDELLQAFSAPVQTEPNDTFYNLQWHYEQIQLPDAWAITTGSSDVRVAVLDTGSAPAQDLAPREVAGIDMISSTAISGDGDGVDSDPTDVGDSTGIQPSSFHGAHVAGTIGAVSNNGFGVAGVTWDTEIMHVRVLGIGGGSTFDILNGVLYSAGLPNSTGLFPPEAADIINMSLGGGGFSTPFQNACSDARAAGTLVVAAAGNENSSTPSFPAAYDDVVSVAAVDFERRRAPYSNFHPTVDIAAPGGDVSADRNGDGFADGVLSTKPDDTVSPTDFDNFTFYQGTSMAAPHVAGVAALMLAVEPTLSPAQIETILSNTATDLGTAGRDDLFGDGLVNALAAVQSAQGTGGSMPALQLSTNAVLVEAAVDTRRVPVANAGTGVLSVSSVSSATTSGGPWLSAVTVTAPTATTTDTAAIDITVNATGLADGVYGGSVTVNSNGGTQVLGVTLALGLGGTPDTFEVFVLAVDAVTFETLAQDSLFTSGSLAYALQGLGSGEYLIVAGTDEDGDDFICDEGEPLCGVFPSLELAETILLDTNQQRAGVNFPLEQATLAASSGGASGFRLLRPVGPGAVDSPSTANAAVEVVR